MSAMALSQVYEARREGRALDGVDLSHLNVRQLDLSGLSARGAILRGRRRPAAVEERPRLWGRLMEDTARTRWGKARFEGTDLTGADLTWAPLQRALMRGSVLRNAVLAEADLRWADLRSADLSGADLSGAVLTEADLGGARWNETTRWPAGFSPER